MLKSAVLVSSVALLVIGSSYAFGLLSNQNNVPTTGVLLSVNVGAYSDSACTKNITSVNWGGVYPGDTKTTVMYIKNLGTANITLTMQAANWNPTVASSYFTLSSTYLGQTLTPGQVLPVTFTLGVASTVNDPITNFGFTIVITSLG